MSLRHRGQARSCPQQVWQQHTWPQGRKTVWACGKREQKGHRECCCPVTLIPVPPHPSKAQEETVLEELGITQGCYMVGARASTLSSIPGHSPALFVHKHLCCAKKAPVTWA